MERADPASRKLFNATGALKSLNHIFAVDIGGGRHDAVQMLLNSQLPSVQASMVKDDGNFTGIPVLYRTVVVRSLVPSPITVGPQVPSSLNTGNVVLCCWEFGVLASGGPQVP